MKYFLLLCLCSFYLQANAHIFVYHRFGDNIHKSTNTTLEELEKEFEYFESNNYKVVTVSQITQKLKNNEENFIIPNNTTLLFRLFSGFVYDSAHSVACF